MFRLSCALQIGKHISPNDTTALGKQRAFEPVRAPVSARRFDRSRRPRAKRLQLRNYSEIARGPENLFSELYSLTPTLSVRWIVDSSLPQGPVPGPIVSPTGELVLMGGQETYGMPGLIQGFSTVDGALLFQIQIPKEPDGTCAVPYARARFTRSGARAYIPAAQLCEVPDEYHSWLYAIDIVTP